MAYTKYSLTPANNTAAPPDGAPEGMLPSAVNDTMRDMMAQIRDVGDGIRGGTYTMTAPIITGGTITGSTINNSAIGGTTAAAGAFTTLSASGVATVSAGTAALPAITTTGDTNTGIFFPAADTIAFTEGGVESMRIDSSGQVGIGTASPNAPLHVTRSTGGVTSTFANTATNNQNANVNAVSDNATAVSLRVFGSAAGSAGMLAANSTMLYTSAADLNLVADNGSGVIKFATGGTTERMRIDSSGNLLVGTTSTILSGTTCFVTGSGNVPFKFSGGSLIAWNSGTSGTRTLIEFGTGAAYSAKGSISTDGTTVSYNVTSDYRLKENVAPMTGALDKVSALKPVTYTWKDGNKDGQGFIAHELQAVVPDCVTGEKDAVDEEGNPVHQGIDTSFLVATLTAAIQELKAELDIVKAELQTLKGN